MFELYQIKTDVEFRKVARNGDIESQLKKRLRKKRVMLKQRATVRL